MPVEKRLERIKIIVQSDVKRKRKQLYGYANDKVRRST